MAVSATSIRTTPLAGNSATFPFSFHCTDVTSVVVTVTQPGLDAVVLLSGQFSVTLNPFQSLSPGGVVTLVGVGPYSATTGVVVSRSTPLTQPTLLPPGGSYRAATVERALDRLNLQNQEQAESVASSVRLPAGEPAIALPAAAARINTVLAFNASGAPVALPYATTPLNFAVQVQGPAGTAALPGYSFSGRTSDGMYSPAVGLLAWSTGGVERLRLDAAGRLSSASLHNNASGAVGAQFIASGTYTPAITGTFNATSSSSITGTWLRVGNVVTVSVGMNLVLTSAVAGTISGIEVSLPIPSNFVNLGDASGAGVSDNGGSMGWRVFASIANDRLAVDSVTRAGGVTSGYLTLTATYVVL